MLNVTSNDDSFDEVNIRGVAVYCASSAGAHKAFQRAAVSLGTALAKDNRPLIYGGGTSGLMGIVSGAAMEAGGEVTGVVPYAFIAAGGEADKTKMKPDPQGQNALQDRQDEQEEKEKVRTVIVDSMHERKMVMAQRSCGFVALPGGFGTWEEVMEVVTWNQLGIHTKPIVVLNVLNYYAPLRQMIRNGIEAGLIPAQNKQLLIFVDCPSSDPEEQEAFDWGGAALQALESWTAPAEKAFRFDWSVRMPTADGAERRGSTLEST